MGRNPQLYEPIGLGGGGGRAVKKPKPIVSYRNEDGFYEVLCPICDNPLGEWHPDNIKVMNVIRCNICDERYKPRGATQLEQIIYDEENVVR